MKISALGSSAPTDVADGLGRQEKHQSSDYGYFLGERLYGLELDRNAGWKGVF